MAAHESGRLRVEGLRVVYGNHLAVDGVSLTVPPGDIHVVLGSNGAGKSSLLNAISGLAPRTGGRCTAGGVELSTLPAHRVARAGVIQVPEGRRVVGNLTVEENLLLGRYASGKRHAGPERFGSLDAIYGLFPNLHERRRIGAGQLSGGEQQMLALGRALMGAPDVLLLDEPSMGLSPRYVDVVLDCVVAVAKVGITVLMVEQNVAALDISSYAYVMRLGNITIEGSSAELRKDERVTEAYVGGGAN